jgi:hypothetical protein
MAIGDLDNDQSPFLEIFAGMGGPDGVATIWKWKDSGYYMSYNITQPGWSNSVAAGDLDADGDTELVLGVGFLDLGEPLVYLYENQSGGWEMMASYAGFSTSSGSVDHMEIADLDNDGLNELVVSHGQDGALQILRYSSTTITNLWSSQFPVVGFATGDVTNDGKADIVAPSGDTVYIIEWQNGEYQATITLPGMGFPYSDGVAIGDIDQDGNNEFAFADFSHPSVLGIYNKEKILSMTFLPYPVPKAIAIGDYDNDAIEPVLPTSTTHVRNKLSASHLVSDTSNKWFMFLNIGVPQGHKINVQRYLRRD